MCCYPTISCTSLRTNYLSFPFNMTPDHQSPSRVADPSSDLSCLPQPLQEAANQTPLFAPHKSSSTTPPANPVTSDSSHHFSLFTMFHLTFRPSHALVTPANPTHSEPPTWATLQFCCTLYHSYCIINFKCKACLAFVFLGVQIYLETNRKHFMKHKVSLFSPPPNLSVQTCPLKSSAKFKYWVFISPLQSSYPFSPETFILPGPASRENFIHISSINYKPFARQE